MSVYKNNRGKWCYDIEWEHPDGSTKRIRKTSPIQTLRGAEQEERKARAALSDGTYGKRTAEDVPTLDEYKPSFMEWCKAERYKPTGIESKEGHFARYLLPLFGKRRLNSFGPEDQKELRLRMSELSVSSYNTSASLMNKLLKVAKDEKRISTEPFAFEILELPETKMGFYDFETYDKMVRAATRIGVIAECIVLLGGDAGLRRGEMWGLMSDRCDIANSRLIIEKSESVIRGVRSMHSTKGLNSRVIPMTNRLRSALERGKHAFGVRVLYVNGKPPTKTSFRQLLANVQREAGLPALGNSHILRHTFCSHLAMRGVPVLTIRELAGHANLETTLGYMHLARGEKERAIAALENDSYGNPMATAAE